MRVVELRASWFRAIMLGRRQVDVAPGEAADFLECDTLQLMSSNERFGHRGSLEYGGCDPPYSNTPALNWGGPL